MNDGVLEVPHVDVDVRQILMGGGHFRRDADGFLVSRDRHRLLVEPAIRQSQVVVPLTGALILLNGLAQDGDRLVEFSHPVVDGPEID